MITVRDWREDDAPVRAFADPAMATQGGPLASEAHALAGIESWHDLAEQGRAVAWAICEDDVPLGGVALSAIEWRHDTGWMSYWTSRAAPGTRAGDGCGRHPGGSRLRRARPLPARDRPPGGESRVLRRRDPGRLRRRGGSAPS